jgi:TRAP transporter TAXI family solute receptor
MTGLAADYPRQQQSSQPVPQIVRVAVAAKGTPYDLIGREVGRQIKLFCPDCDVQFVETAGGIQNAEWIREGRLDVAFANTGVAWEASIGMGSFAGKEVPLRAIAALYPHNMHLVAQRSLGAKRLADLRGRRLATGLPGSGTEVVALRMLKAAGLDAERDVKRERVGVVEAVKAMKEGQLDAFIFGSAAPVSAIGEVLAADCCALLPTADLWSSMEGIYRHIYRTGSIPAATYRNQPSDVASVDVWDVLVVSEKIPGPLAFQLARALFERKEAFVAAHPNMRSVSLGEQSNLTPVSFHLGAQRYFATRGLQPFARQFGFAAPASGVRP